MVKYISNIFIFKFRSQLRGIASDSSIMYEDGDITSTPVSSPDTNRCPCGYKHWYRSNEYDNPPQEVSIRKLHFY